jgi:WD40 repeat protein
VLIPWQEEWSHIVRWLDNDKLLILNHGSSLTMSIYDPATGAQNRVSGEISSSFIPSVSWREAPVIFSPDLTRILVPDGESILKLFDAETKKEIAVFEPVLNEHVPVWLPDASGFIFSNYIWVPDTTMGFRPIGDTLVFVSRDGDAKNIVELLDSPSAMVIDSYSWSPNSQLIAFWTMDVVDSFGYLTILDAITGEISNTCIESKFLRANDVVPVWSSDGNQVAFQIFEGTSFQSGKLVIYDLNKNVAIKFDENLRPIGWMNNEP